MNAESMLRPLPHDWPMVRIGDALLNDIEMFDKRTFPAKEFTYIDISSVDSHSKQVVTPKRLRTSAAPSRATYIVRKGDILVSTVRPNLNAVAMIPHDLDGAVCSSGFCVLRLTEAFAPLYFFLYLIAPQFVLPVSALVQGAMYPAISDDDVKNFLLPTPPIRQEQQQMAECLAEKWRVALEMRRAAQRQLEASESLTQSHLANIFPFQNLAEIPVGWSVERLRDLSRSIDYGLSLSASKQPRGPKFVRITDIQDGEVNWDTVPYCDCRAEDAVSAKLQDGDILFARTGATTGKSFLILNPPTAVFASYLIRVQCCPDRVLPDYLYAFFQSKLYWQAINKGARGGAQAGFNATMLGDLCVPLPASKDEQAGIAASFQKVDQTARAIRDSCECQLDAISALPAATLRQFFNFGDRADG